MDSDERKVIGGEADMQQHQQMMMEQEELLRLQQAALAEKQHEEMVRQEELFRLQQEALIEKQREEGVMRQHVSVLPPTTGPPPTMVTSGMPPQQGMPPVQLPPPPAPPGMLQSSIPPPPITSLPPPSVSQPPPTQMNIPPPVTTMVPPGTEGDETSRPPPLMSLNLALPSEETAKEVKLPQALEQALAFKTERAKQVGVRPEDIEKIESEGLPSAPPVQSKPPPPPPRRGLPTAYDEDDEDEDEEGEGGSKKKSQESKNKKRKKKKKKNRAARRQQQEIQQNEERVDKDKDENDAEKENVEVEYVQESLDMNELDPIYRQFGRILEQFRISEPEKKLDELSLLNEAKAAPVIDLKKVPKIDVDDSDDDDMEEEKKPEESSKLSKRKLKKLTRLSVAELKQLVQRPDVVEMHDVTGRDPKLLVQLKAFRNTVPVPRHWCFKRKYLQGKRGIEKAPFELPDFIKKTGIMEMRAALQEKEDQRTLKAKMRERVRPKLGKIDIDYQKLHDAFFKWQTKPRMTIHGDLYYEGKEFETRLKEKKPGELTDELRTALGMPVGPNSNRVPPPWLIAMQRYGPPPSYPNLKIPGLNAPIPDGCSFGYHAGGWGKPPVDEVGKPLYGDVFGTQTIDSQAVPAEEEVDRTMWGELESESEEESEEELESEEEEGEGEGAEDATGLVTPAEGLVTPSGITSMPAGMETPEMIELRKRKIESEMEGGETPALYTVLPEKRVDRVGASMMGSTHIYDMTAAAGGGGGGAVGIPASRRPTFPGAPEAGTVELALDPSELDLVDTEAMAARYEQTLREQQSQLQKEDLSDMLVEHVNRQKNKRKRQQQQDNKQAKRYKEFKF